MNMQCPHCGAPNHDGARFCTSCGREMVTAAPAPAPQPAAQQPAAPQQPVAPQQPAAPVGVASPPRPKKQKKTALIVALALVVAVAAGGALWYFQPWAKDDDAPEADASEPSLEEREPPKQEPEKQPEPDETSAADVQTLVEAVGQAETYLESAGEEVSAQLDAGDVTASITKLDEILETLPELQAAAGTVGDAKLEAAADEYFRLSQNAWHAARENLVFAKDFLDYSGIFSDETFPDMNSYSSISAYYNDFDQWLETARAEYEAIDSCPANLAWKWKDFGGILDMLGSSIYKCSLGIAYEDALRTQAGINMINRTVTTVGLVADGYIDTINSEMDHAERQSDLAAALAEEIRAYADMDAAARDAYTFENLRMGEASFEYDVVDTIYPSLYNTYDAFLIIRTGCLSGTADIVVEAEIPGLTQSYKETFTLGSAYTEIPIKPPAATGELDLASTKQAQLNVSITQPDGTILEAKSFPLTIKSKYDFEWYGDEYGVSTQDNILCFLTPEAPEIATLKRQAIQEISEITEGQMESFVGYQETGWNHYVGTYLQAAGIMRAMSRLGIRYNMDSFSISGSNQHILFPADVINQRGGLCIETALTVASALQAAGMHVFLYFPPGHAMVAVEVWDGRGNDTTGTGEYFLIETTALTDASNSAATYRDNANGLMELNTPSGGPITYLDALELSDDIYVVDCGDSNVLGLTPFFY